MFCRSAPVNAPFSWPNSSLSSNVSGIAAQLIGTKGPFARGLSLWIALREQLLAGAAFAEQQDRHIGRRQLLDVAQHPQHFWTGGDDAVDRRTGRGVGQPAVLGLEIEHLLGAADDHPQNLDVDRLLIEIVGAERDRAQRVLAGLVAGGDDHLGCGRQFADFGQCRQALRRAVGIGRQAEIEDRNRHRMPAQSARSLRDGWRRLAPCARRMPSAAAARVRCRRRRSAATWRRRVVVTFMPQQRVWPARGSRRAAE